MNWTSFISGFVVGTVCYLIGYYVCERQYKKQLQHADNIDKLNLQIIQNHQDQIADYQNKLNQLKDFAKIVIDELNCQGKISIANLKFHHTNINLEDIRKLIS